MSSAQANSDFPWGMQIAPLILAFLVSVIFIGLATPRRISGVPYNGGFPQWLLGDTPSWVSHTRKKGEMYTWLRAQIVSLNSPIIQVSVRPFARPWIVLADFREAQDILTRRTKTFDRAEFMQKVFRTVIPHGMITFKSEDPRLQANKMLVRGFMAPTVLNEVIGQQLYKSMIEVLELWKIKARLAQDHPFDMREDMAHSALDALLGAIFNLDKTHSSVAPQIRSLSFLDSVPIPGNDRSPVHFAQAPIPVVARAIVTLTKSLAISFQSPLSEWHHWLFGQLTEMRNAYATKEKLITDEIEKAIERLGNGTDGTYALATCLLDDLLRHEVMSAARAKREPNFKSRTVYDELLEMVIAGYDTTSATSMWALKHLSNNPGAQEHLRNELQRALPDAKGRYPTVQEIVSLRVPYLDATVQEVFRISLSASAHARTATEDTIVLGHFIPKGTNVFMLINGPSFMSPPFPIREELRSKTSQMAKAETPEWDYATLSEFRPERWLVEDEHGQAAVDLAAAPQMLFSLGPRACFGKKMAVLSMKINLVCMVWAFDLLPVPDQLNSFEGAEVLARTPTQGYIRLSERPL